MKKHRKNCVWGRFFVHFFRGKLNSVRNYSGKSRGKSIPREIVQENSAKNQIRAKLFRKISRKVFFRGSNCKLNWALDPSLRFPNLPTTTTPATKGLFQKQKLFSKTPLATRGVVTHGRGIGSWWTHEIIFVFPKVRVTSDPRAWRTGRPVFTGPDWRGRSSSCPAANAPPAPTGASGSSASTEKSKKPFVKITNF
jgi:hypothetical protein